MSECELLVEEVNSGLSKVREVLPDAGSHQPADYRRVAIRYLKLKDRLTQRPWQDSKIASGVKDYGEVLSRAQKRADAYAQLLSKTPTGKKAKLSHQNKLSRQSDMARGERGRETSVIRKLNELCHPK